jgi:hypothetical protein
MAKKKISGLPAGSALNGTELVPIVQTGTTKRITTQDIANLGNSSGVEGSGTINRLPKFTASSTIGDSKFFDDGTNQGTETTTAINRFIMSANASIAKIFSFRSGNLPRWAFRVDGTESGANAGADLAIRRYDDAGTFIDAPMTMDRSDGTISVLKDATINGVRVGRGAGNIPQNISLGSSALNANTTGANNTAIGTQALNINTTASNNVAVGNYTLGLCITGANNTAIGAGGTLYNNTASNNTAVGFEAGFSNTSGTGATALGYSALRANTTGADNTALGNSALLLNTTGSSNTAVGLNSLYNMTTGSNNTAVGRSALASNSTGSNNTGLGYDVSSGGFDGSVILGHSASATASNQFVVGSASVNAGAVATEVLVSDRSWSVRINGTAYKILLKS